MHNEQPNVNTNGGDTQMDVQQVRLNRLRKLAKEHGGITAFADKIGKNRGQISNLIGRQPKKAVGNRQARDIEETLGLEHGYLDRPIGNALPSIADKAFLTEVLGTIQQALNIKQVDMNRVDAEALAAVIVQQFELRAEAPEKLPAELLDNNLRSSLSLAKIC